MNTRVVRLGATLFIFACSASAALAHHPMGGETPATFSQGLLSGLGHPVIGTDHLAFIVAVGLLAAVTRAPVWTPLLFVGGTLIGCLAGVGGVAPGITEWLILASVLVLGGAMALGHRRLGAIEMGGFALAGIFHGIAYAEAVIGAETSPIIAYLIGFALIQAVIAVGVMLAAKAIWQGEKLTLSARLGGALVAGIGIAFAIESIEALLLPGIA